ncbi:hypothetical protein KO465_02315 [Candidatus Micrarchaeota archaeon]|nr:hypothetical protein [Candidatus Micrarchaeota archaeon]
MINFETHKKGFLSFILVMIFGSVVMASLYTYTASYYPQNYQQALISERIYYQTLDAKHNIGGLAREGLWLGTVIHMVRSLFCIEDCFCNPAFTSATYTATLSGIPIGPAHTLICNIIGVMKVFIDPCEFPACKMEDIPNIGIQPVLDPHKLDDSIDPNEDLRRGVSFMLFTDQLIRFNDEEKTVLYICADTPSDFEDCVSDITTLHSFFQGNYDVQSVKDSIESTNNWNSGKCAVLVPTSFDLKKLKWETSCDDKIITELKSGYGSIDIVSSNSNNPHPRPDIEVNSNVKFNTLGVVGYDKTTNSISYGYVPPNKEFKYSEDLSSEDQFIDFIAKGFGVIDDLIGYKLDIEGGY